MGVLAGTSLLLAAAIAERRRDPAARAGSRRRACSTGRTCCASRSAPAASPPSSGTFAIRSRGARPSSSTILGLPAEDGVMTADQWGRFVHADDRDRMAAHLARALDGEEPAAADYRITAADGTHALVELCGPDPAKTPEGGRMLGTVVDITERKRLEDELRHHAAERRTREPRRPDAGDARRMRWGPGRANLMTTPCGGVRSSRRSSGCSRAGSAAPRPGSSTWSTTTIAAAVRTAVDEAIRTRLRLRRRIPVQARPRRVALDGGTRPRRLRRRPHAAEPVRHRHRRHRRASAPRWRCAKPSARRSPPTS